jgi:endonuclease/exonuclease/phosphatase family metal-dependent hydrolase
MVLQEIGMKYVMALILLTLAVSAWSTTAPVTIKLLTWNVYMLPKPLKFSIQGDRTQLIIQELLKVDHDIIVFQEAFTKSFRENVGQALQEKYPHQVDLGRSGRWRQVMTSGLFALSRYPISPIDHSFYNTCTGVDCFASKGVLLLNVELPYNKNLHLSTTQLNAGDYEAHRGARWAQVEQIQSLYQQSLTEKTETIPLILAGDLNIDVKEKDYQDALAFLNMESPEIENPSVPSSQYDIPCYKRVKNPYAQRVDHILLNQRKANAKILNLRVRPFFGVLKGTECALSDHQAIEAVIRIK